MPQLPLPTDPLTRAITPYLEDVLSPADPAATLAALIDLAGGVALAEGLADLDAPAATAAGDAQAIFHDAVAHIEAQLADAFANAWRPRYRLPGPARALQTWQDAGVSEAPTRGARKKALKTMARVLWAPFTEFLETQLKRARFALRDLAQEVTPILAAHGPDAARLIQLDAALTAGTRQQVEAIYRRVPLAWARTFERLLLDNAATLPEAPRAEAFAPWFSEDGWVRRNLTDGQRLVTELVARERRKLAALVQACTR